MIKNIFFSTALVFATCLQLYSMEPVCTDNVNQFSIKTDDLHVQFRPINLSYIAQAADDLTGIIGRDDHQKLMDHCGDFDAVRNMFGLHVAIPFKLLHIASPETVLDIYIKAYADKLQKMPDDQKIEYHWFIEKNDGEEEHDFVGELSLSTYIDDRPDKYSDKLLLEVGLVLSEKYRRKGLTSKLLVPVLQKLYTFQPFQNGIFCFNARADNEPVHKIAAKLEARLICSRDIKRDFGLWEEDQLFHLFVIPSQ